MNMSKVFDWIRASRKAIVPLLAGGLALAVQHTGLILNGEPVESAEMIYTGLLSFISAIGVWFTANDNSSNNGDQS